MTIKMGPFLVFLSITFHFCACDLFQPLLHPGEDFPQPYVTYGKEELKALNSKHGVLVAASINEGKSLKKIPIFNIFQDGCSPPSTCYEFNGYAFDDQNYPKWTKFTENYLTPEIHFIPGKNKTLLYFTAAEELTNDYAVGYFEMGSENASETSKKIIGKPGKDILGVTILKDFQASEKTWKIYMYYSDGNHVYGVRLNDEGTQLYNNTCPELLLEGKKFERPSVIKRNLFYYLLFTTTGDPTYRGYGSFYQCQNNYGSASCSPTIVKNTHVTRSRTAIGSFSESMELKEIFSVDGPFSNCSMSKKDERSIYHMVCEINYKTSPSQVNSEDVPTQPGTVIIGWLSNNWPFIHPYEMDDLNN